jgi:hypothetical protein
VGTHPELWVATENNMVADHGAAELIRFAPAPEKVVLDRVSREAVMDREPWTYAITAAEMLREGRIDPAAAPGSGRIPDPRTYATVEACADVTDATLALEVGVRGPDSTVAWYPTDRGEPRFRVARSGCFRASAPIPEDKRAVDVVGLRVVAYTRPPREGEAPLSTGTGRVTLKQVNRVFVLDHEFRIQLAPGATWTETSSCPAMQGRCGSSAGPARVRSAKSKTLLTEDTEGTEGTENLGAFWGRSLALRFSQNPDLSVTSVTSAVLRE